MPSILTGCLMILKLMITVTDAILSTVKSVVNSVMQSKDGSQRVIEEAPETVSVQLTQSSGSQHSNILEAFNLRRSNSARFAQADYVSNLTSLHENAVIKKDMEGEKSRSLPLVISELRPLDHSSCGDKSDNVISTICEELETCIPCDNCICGRISFPECSAIKAETNTPYGKELKQLGPKSIVFRKISTSKINTDSCIETVPSSSEKFLESNISRSSQKENDTKTSIKVENANNCTKYIHTKTSTDLCQDSNDATKRLDSHFSSPEKDNKSFMGKLIDFEISEKPISVCLEGTLQHNHENASETSTQISVGNVFGKGHSIQPNDNAPDINVLSTGILHSDKDEEQISESTHSIENGKLNTLNNQESSKDDVLLKLQDNPTTEYIHEDAPLDKFLPNFGNKRFKESAKHDIDSEKLLLPQCSRNESSTNKSNTAMKSKNIFQEYNLSVRDLDTIQKQLKFLDILSADISKNELPSKNEDIPSQSAVCQDVDERHELLLEEDTIDLMKQTDEIPNTMKQVDKSLDKDEMKFVTSEIPSDESCWTRTCSESEVGFVNSLPDQELDDFGLPIFTEKSYGFVDDIDEEMPLLYERVNQNIDAIETENDFRHILNSSFDLERRSKETSTQIVERDQDLSEQSNFSSEGSLDEFKEAISGKSESLYSFSGSLEKDLMVNEKDSKTTVCPSETLVEDPAEDSSIIENKDWENCAAEVSKQFDKSISYLEEMDDSDEVVEYIEGSCKSYTKIEKVSNKNTEQVYTSNENEVDNICQLSRPSEMDAASMSKKLHETSMDQSPLLDVKCGLIVSSYSEYLKQNFQSLPVNEELETGNLKNVIPLENHFGKELESKDNDLAMTVPTFDENIPNFDLVSTKVSPSASDIEMCTAHVEMCSEVDKNQESNLVSPQASIYTESTYVDVLSNAQTIEYHVSLFIGDVRPDQNDECSTTQESEESVTSNDVCATNTIEVDNDLVSEGLVSSIYLHSTPVNNSTDNLDNIAKQSCTLPLIEEVLNNEDNSESKTGEIKEPVSVQSSILKGPSVSAIHVYPASELSSQPIIYEAFDTTVDNSEVIAEKITGQVTLPSCIEDALASVESSERDSDEIYEQFLSQSAINDPCSIAETTEVANDLVAKDITFPLSPNCNDITPIYNAGSNVQDDLLDQKNVENCEMQAPRVQGSPQSPTIYALTVAETVKVGTDFAFNDLSSPPPVCIKSTPVNEAINEIKEVVKQVNTHSIIEMINYEVDATSEVEFKKLLFPPPLQLNVSNVEASPSISYEELTTGNSEDNQVATTQLTQELLTKKRVLEEQVSQLFPTNGIFTNGDTAELDNDMASKTLIYLATGICDSPIHVNTARNIADVIKQYVNYTPLLSYEDNESNSYEFKKTVPPHSPTLNVAVIGVNIDSSEIVPSTVCDLSKRVDSSEIIEKIAKQVASPSFIEEVSFEDSPDNTDVYEQVFKPTYDVCAITETTEVDNDFVFKVPISQSPTSVKSSPGDATSKLQEIVEQDATHLTRKVLDYEVDCTNSMRFKEPVDLPSQTLNESNIVVIVGNPVSDLVHPPIDNEESAIGDNSEDVAKQVTTESLTEDSNTYRVSDEPAYSQSLIGETVTVDGEKICSSEQTSVSSDVEVLERSSEDSENATIDLQGACESPKAAEDLEGIEPTGKVADKPNCKKTRKSRKKKRKH